MLNLFMGINTIIRWWHILQIKLKCLDSSLGLICRITEYENTLLYILLQSNGIFKTSCSKKQSLGNFACALEINLQEKSHPSMRLQNFDSL